VFCGPDPLGVCTGRINSKNSGEFMSIRSRLSVLKEKPVSIKFNKVLEIIGVYADRGFDIITEVEEDCFVVKHANGQAVVYAMSLVTKIFL